MNVQIKKTIEMPMLSRKRVVSMVSFEKETPSRVELNKKIAALTDSNPSLVITKHIYTRFGQRTAKVISHVYSKEEDLKINEEAGLIEKNKEKAEETAQEE